ARAAVSGEVKSSTSAPGESTPAAAPVPSVMVESSAHKTIVDPAPPVAAPPNGAPSAAAASVDSPAEASSSETSDEERPTNQISAVAPIEPEKPSRGEPSGEWFDKDYQAGQQLEAFDDIEEPRRNRGPLIIAAVAGGLTVVGLVVFLFLPK